MQEDAKRMISEMGYDQRTQSDVLHCISKYTNLKPGESIFTHDDGQESMMLCLAGTVPISYSSVQYHIPVDIFLAQGYPRAPPIVYVRPTVTMDVKANSQVNRNGRVQIPLLTYWDGSQNLMTLCDHLSLTFSQQPPVYAKNRPVTNPPTYDTVVSPEEPDSRTVSTQNLTKKIQGELEQFYNSMGKEMDTEYAKQAQLQKNKETIRSRQFEYEEALALLEEQQKIAADSILSLETWLEERKDDDGELNMDQVIQPSDEASGKLLDLVSETAAIDDTLFALDQALTQGALELPAFLREVRKLSRQQFLHIAHSQKVFEAKRNERPPRAKK